MTLVYARHTSALQQTIVATAEDQQTEPDNECNVGKHRQ